MKKLILIATLFTLGAHAQTKFPLGNGMEKWGVPLKVPDSDLSLRLGARYQSLATIETEENLQTESQRTFHDFQSRRIRLQFEADLARKATYYMDLRNDGANFRDRGEQNFIIGDAYVSVPIQEGDLTYSTRLFRAKVDVARTLQASSADLIFLNRANITNEVTHFVSQNRRATNVQLNGNYLKQISFHLVLGDGVASRNFYDSQGDTPEGSGAGIERQNFMYGGKLRFHPFEGWEDLKVTETYFGEGQHFSVGVGAYNASDIHFVASGQSGVVSRNLYNVELSGHYKEWNFVSEYFKMDGVIEDFDAPKFNKGRGEGYYVQGEKLFRDFYFLAPFVRYENWNRFIERGDNESDSQLYGVNWYANGNRFRITAAYQIDYLGKDIEGDATRIEFIHLATMWHF